MRGTVAIGLMLYAGCGSVGASDEPAGWVWRTPPGFPAAHFPDDNPISAGKVELGRHLFYDTRLSSTQTESCASCHVQAHAFAGINTTELGATGELGRRNAPPLVNTAWNSVQTWANPSLVTLEQQTLVPLFGTAPIELGLEGLESTLLDRLAAEPVYPALFAAAFPEDVAITLDHVVKALTSFDRAIVSSGSSAYDRFVAGDSGALTAQQQQGLEVFNSEKLECHHCHNGFAFTVSYMTADDSFIRYTNDGLYNVDGAGAYPLADQGEIEITGEPTQMGRYRPPSLRNVAVTAPYMHDGSIATLDEVLTMYARGGRLIATGPDAGDGALNPHKNVLVSGFALSDDDRAALLAFFDSLTDSELLTDPQFASPW